MPVNDAWRMLFTARELQCTHRADQVSRQLRNGDGVTIAAVLVCDQLREVRIRNRLEFFSVVYIDVVESQQIEKVRVVDHAETEELVNARFRCAVLELGQPAIRDTELLVAFYIGDSPARLFDVANSDVSLIAKAFQFLTSRHSTSRKLLDRRTVFACCVEA